MVIKSLKIRRRIGNNTGLGSDKITDIDIEVDMLSVYRSEYLPLEQF
jgi:hypothetical protein